MTTILYIQKYEKRLQGYSERQIIKSNILWRDLMVCEGCGQKIENIFETCNTCKEVFCKECLQSETEICDFCNMMVCNSCVNNYDDGENITNACDMCVIKTRILWEVI